MRRYVIREPLEKVLPRSHWNKKHGRVRKAKKSFDTEREALSFIKKHRLKGYHVYQCPVCNKYHIGHNGKTKDSEPKENE